MFTPISFDYFWFKVHFVRYFNGYISLFIRNICLEYFLQLFILNYYLSSMLRCVYWMQLKNKSSFHSHFLSLHTFSLGIETNDIEQWLLISICCSFAIGDSVVCVCSFVFKRVWECVSFLWFCWCELLFLVFSEV